MRRSPWTRLRTPRLWTHPRWTRRAWTRGIAVPVAVLTATGGLALAAGAVAVPGSDSADSSGMSRAKPTTSAPSPTRTTSTTKPPKTQKKGCKPGCTLLVNDFETGGQGWTDVDGMALGVTTDSAASGEQSLAVTRITGASGPMLTVTSQSLQRPKGSRYLLTLAVQVPGPRSGKPVTVQVGGAYAVVAETVYPNGGWQTLRAAFVPLATTVTIAVVEGRGDPCREYPKVLQAVGVDDVRLGVPAKPVTLPTSTTPTSTACITPTPTVTTSTTDPTTTSPTTTVTTTRHLFTCTAMDMPVNDGPGSTVTVRNQGPASLADWTVTMSTGAKPVKVGGGLWSYVDGVLTVMSPPNQGALMAGDSVVISLEGANGSAILPYPVALNGVSCAVAMP